MNPFDEAQPNATPSEPRGPDSRVPNSQVPNSQCDPLDASGAAEADACTQIQIDLSAMLDGELEARAVRKVVVHADSCATCRVFLDGIRAQVRAHRAMHQVLTGADDDRVDLSKLVGVGPGKSGSSIPVAELRRQLTENRAQLARIFYELGRGFVLLGDAPSFSRVVAREPAPITDVCRRGRHLVDEVERLGGTPAAGAEWEHAKQVFDEDLVQTAADNLRKGIGLLEDALMLAPDHDAARIYLGHALHVAGDRREAERVFLEALELSNEPGSRAFARMHLGNVYLELGRPDLAERLFLELVQSGEVARRPDFGLTYFNLALASAMQGRFDDCRDWLSRLYAEMPHKQRMIAEELRARHDFVASLSSQPSVYEAFSTNFPFWFPKREAC